MTQPPFISADDLAVLLDWQSVISALRSGHRLKHTVPKDTLIEYGNNHLLTRSCVIKGLGSGAKVVTIHPDNSRKSPPSPTVQGVYLLFDEHDGSLQALIDGPALTDWKTASDSVLGAQLLANPKPRQLTILGSGRVAHSLLQAYSARFPTLEQFTICARSKDRANALAAEFSARDLAVGVVNDPEEAVANADIVCCATSSSVPVISGTWLRKGSHVDLVGAHGPDMREADDAVMARGRLFVDCVDTTIEHIGELIIPIRNGTISDASQIRDLYDLLADDAQIHGRNSPDDVTVFKNGGGAHLDLMVAQLAFQKWQQKRVSS